MSECSVEGCDRTDLRNWQNGMCNLHWLRWRNHGDPLKGRRPNGMWQKWLLEHAVDPGHNDCVIWPFYRDKNGYARGGSKDLAYRWVCEKVHGPPPAKNIHAAHQCGRGSSGCVSGRHVEWKTPSENEKDKLRHGTDHRGERHHNTRFTADQVRAIRSIPYTITNREIADLVGSSNSSISRIRAGVDWRFLPRAPDDARPKHLKDSIEV